MIECSRYCFSCKNIDKLDRRVDIHRGREKRQELKVGLTKFLVKATFVN